MNREGPVMVEVVTVSQCIQGKLFQLQIFNWPGWVFLVLLSSGGNSPKFNTRERRVKMRLMWIFRCEFLPVIRLD